MEPILLRRLRVESVSDPTPDLYGQPGFSALIAYVDADDDALVRELRQAADNQAVVVVRCATLEVAGRVGKMQFADAAPPREAISISVEDLRYFKPKHGVPVERRRLPLKKRTL